MDMQTGNFLAMMDANWITAMRTGAVAAHSIKLLAKTNFRNISILGLGNTARATLLVLLALFPSKHFNIKLLKYKNQAEIFIERFIEYENLSFEIVGDYISLIKESDVIISCATYFDNDICSDEYFDEGVLLVPVHTRGFSNCDLFFDKVYGDDTNHICHFKYFNQFKSFSEISDVLTGKALGRENNKERIIAYNIGLSIHDINFAAHIYQLLQNREQLLDIDLHEPKEKFWI